MSRRSTSSIARSLCLAAIFATSAVALAALLPGRSLATVSRSPQTGELREVPLDLPRTVGGTPPLAAKLVLPAGRATHAVVLVPVAGPSDADMTLGQLAIHREAAAVLARHGIASLRVASRGEDGSGGAWVDSTFEDRTRDLLAAVETLRAEPSLAGAHLGLVGTSEGGALSIAAAHEAGASFVVALSAPATDGASALRWQRDRLLASSPLPAPTRQAFVSVTEEFLAAVQVRDPDAVRRLLSGAFGEHLLPRYSMVPTEAEARVRFALSPWYRSQLELDVRPALAALRVPLLAIYGGEDRVVDATASAAAITATVPEPSLVTVLARPERDHLLLATSPETQRFDDELWEEIARWIAARSE